MANKFIEKHKRKSLLALLLMLFRGRTKYIVLLIIIILFSIPFVATSDMVERFFGLSPVRYAVKLLGLESVMASINPKYSGDILKATFDKLKQEYEANSLWNKITGGVEDRSGIGTLAMVRAGEGFGLEDKAGKKSKDKNTAGIDGVVDKENAEKGEGADGVNFDDIISGRLSKDSLGLSGLNLGKGSFPYSSNSIGYGPYADKSLFGAGKGGIGYAGKSNLSSSSLNNIKNNVPNVSDPTLKKGKVKTAKMGNLTAFGWKNVGYTKKGSKVDVNVSGSKRALFQMGETLATTSMAYKQNPAYEYQATYTGSTYDGTSVSGDIINTAGDTNTTLPDTGYVSDIIDSSQHWQEIAQKCQEAQAVHGTNISKLQDEIDEISKTMTNPPKCCKNVSSWNNKVNTLVQKCNQLNNESTLLAQKCGSQNPQTVNCQQTYGKLYIKPCSKWKCWLGFILAIVGALIGFLIAGPIGAIIGAAIGFAIGSVASIYFQMAAMGAAFAGAGAYFADQKSEKAIKVVEDINKDIAGGDNSVNLNQTQTNGQSQKQQIENQMNQLEEEKYQLDQKWNQLEAQKQQLQSQYNMLESQKNGLLANGYAYDSPEVQNIVSQQNNILNQINQINSQQAQITQRYNEIEQEMAKLIEEYNKLGG